MDKSNHGNVGEALYLKFTEDNFTKMTSQEVKDGNIFSVNDLWDIYKINSTVPLHIDNTTQGDYEAVCEFGTEIH